MQDEQFRELINKLTEINETFKQRKYTYDQALDSFQEELPNRSYIQISKLVAAFNHMLEAKTGWGRNEVKTLLTVAIESAS